MTQHEIDEERLSAVSALVDGELNAEALKGVLSESPADAEVFCDWDCFHLIGDALRSGDRVAQPSSADFVASTMSKIRAIEAQGAGARAGADDNRVAAPEEPAPAAANDSYRWKLVAGFASVAAVAAVGWAGLGLGGFVGVGQNSSAALASASGPTALLASATGSRGSAVGSDLAASEPTRAEEPSMLRNAELDRYLAAHSQAVGGAALQTTGSFVRNASFTSTEDGQ